METETFPYKWYALFGLGLLSFTAFLDFTIVTTALPFIQKDLNASVLQLQWVVTIFAMVLCMFMIIAGKSGDLLGPKKVFFFGFILFGIAAAGAGLSPTIQWLIFFRAIQGFAAAIIVTVGVSLLPLAFPPNEQTRAIGVYTAFNGAGLALGPFIGGALIYLLSWRWVFWINVPIIIVGILLCSFSLKPAVHAEHREKIDWLGLFLLVVGLGSLVFGIIQCEQIGLNQPLAQITLAIGIIASAVLLIVENKIQNPLLDLSIFKNSHVLLSLIVCIAAGFPAYTFMFFDSLYLALMRQQSAFLVGITLLCVPVVQVLISIFLEKLVSNFGIFNLLIYGVAAGFITAIFHAFFTPTINIFFVLFALILMGYIWGIANAGTITALIQSVKPEKMGAAVGTIFTFWNLAGSIFLALSTVLFHWQESRTMNASLIDANIQLNPEQHHQISVLLSDPEAAQSILKTFVGGNVQEILQFFYASFMSGFHAVAWFAAAMLAIYLILAVRLR